MSRAHSPFSLLPIAVLVLGGLALPSESAAVGHFMCYKAKQSSSRLCSPASLANAGAACSDDAACGGDAGAKAFCVKNTFDGADVQVADPLEDLQRIAGKPAALCAPANKNGEDPTAPALPDHLEAYATKPAKICSDDQSPCVKSTDCNAGAKCAPPKHTKTRVLIEDQLGRLVLETKKGNRLLVPSSKDHEVPIDPPTAAIVDHHMCYSVVAKKRVCEGDASVKCKSDEDCETAEVGGACSQGFPKGLFVLVEDQFQERLYELKKPTRWCPAATKTLLPGGTPEPPADADAYVTCYQAKPAKGVCDAGAPENANGACKNDDDCGGATCLAQPKHEKATTLHVNNQFGAGLLDTVKAEELCIPNLTDEPECDALVGTPVVDAPTADLNDDGQIDQADVEVLLDPTHFDKSAGEMGYIDGLDIAANTQEHPTLDPNAPDGTIDQADVDAVRLLCGATGVATSPTRLSGFVFDGVGNPLEGTGITGGQGGLSASTDGTGGYDVAVAPSDVGLGEINFFGSTAIDPTPGGSDEYPTIPHKPIFLNGGTNNVFRAIYLPERDLTGAVLLDDANSIAGGAPGSRVTTQPVAVNNTAIGATLELPAGCTVIPPPGETAQLSIAALKPANVPVPPPPGLSSSMFVTYQPGGTQISCTGGSFTTTFDNVDLLPVGATPDLYGVENGAFVVVASCAVVDDDSDSEVNDPDDKVVCGPIATPFTMAWYAAIPPGPPCPLTLVAVETLCNGIPTPGVSVSIGNGFPACTSSAVSAVAGFPNVPAGPSGPACLSNPFEITAVAWDGPGSVGTASAIAVPGGITAIDVEVCEATEGDVGDISFVSVQPAVFSPGIGDVRYPLLAFEIDFAQDFPSEPDSDIEFYFYFSLDGGFVEAYCNFTGVPGGIADFCELNDFDEVLPNPGQMDVSMQWDFAGSASRFQFFLRVDLDTNLGFDQLDIFGSQTVGFSFDVNSNLESGQIFDSFPNGGETLLDVLSGLEEAFAGLRRLLEASGNALVKCPSTGAHQYFMIYSWFRRTGARIRKDVSTVLAVT